MMQSHPLTGSKSTKWALSREQYGGAVYLKLEDTIYIIYTPNLGLGLVVFDREREQGRFKGSIEGVRGSIRGAMEAPREYRGEQRGAVEGSLN